VLHVVGAYDDRGLTPVEKVADAQVTVEIDEYGAHTTAVEEKEEEHHFLPKKLVYVGDVDDRGRPHGRGKYYYTDGGTYDGQFKSGVPHGVGTEKIFDGATSESLGSYEGQFEKGQYKVQILLLLLLLLVVLLLLLLLLVLLLLLLLLTFCLGTRALACVSTQTAGGTRGVGRRTSATGRASCSATTAPSCTKGGGARYIYGSLLLIPK